MATISQYINTNNAPNPFPWSSTTLDTEVTVGTVPSSSVQAPPLRYSFDHLSSNQKWLLKQYQKNKKKLTGLQVKVIADNAGRPRNLILKGLIVHLPVKNWQAHWKIVDSERGTLLSFYLWQIETVDELHITPALKRLETLKNLAGLVTYRVNLEYNNVDSKIESTKRDIVAFEQRKERLIHDFKELEFKKKNMQLKAVSPKTLAEQIKKLNKHAQIREAYVTTNGNIIAKTKPLKSGSLAIGKFIFYISYDSSNSYLRAVNLDWGCCDCDGHTGSDHSHQDYLPHPNIEGDHICFGANEKEVLDMYNQGLIYQLIDFLVIFFSTFPHQDASPYIEYDKWLQHRFGKNKDFKPNSYFLEEKL